MKLFKHSHHKNSNGIFLEAHDDDYEEERRKEFDEDKSEEESPKRIALRHRCFGEVQVPGSLRRVYEEWDRAAEEWGRTAEEWDRAAEEWGRTAEEWDRGVDDLERSFEECERAYEELKRAYEKWNWALISYGLNRLHREVCLSVTPDCPWDGVKLWSE